jgi:hypothetical protein
VGTKLHDYFLSISKRMYSIGHSFCLFRCRKTSSGESYSALRGDKWRRFVKNNCRSDFPLASYHLTYYELTNALYHRLEHCYQIFRLFSTSSHFLSVMELEQVNQKFEVFSQNQDFDQVFGTEAIWSCSLYTTKVVQSCFL